MNTCRSVRTPPGTLGWQAGVAFSPSTLASVRYISARVSSYFHSLSISLLFHMSQMQSGHSSGSKTPQSVLRTTRRFKLVSNFSDTKRPVYCFQPLFFFCATLSMCLDTNRLPSVLACYFHHRPLVSSEHAEMVRDEMVAAEGLVWHRTGQRDEAGHFLLPPQGGIVALCKSSFAPLFFLKLVPSLAFGGFRCFINGMAS